MAKDILLYGTISEYNTMYFFDQINEAEEEDPETDFELRVCCDGGGPDFGMELIRKIQELGERMYVKIGQACHSMALFIPCYLDTSRVECIDATLAVLHRGAFPDWIESAGWFPGSIQEQIMVKANKDLEKAFRAKVDVSVLESLPQFTDKNITLKDIFATDTRIEVLLTASDLKKIGLVSRVTKLIPAKAATMTAQMEAFKKCTSLQDFKLAAKYEAKIEDKNENNNTMTLAELREKHPTVYGEILQAGIAHERDRVEGLMVFNEVDPVGVKAAIESGKPLSSKQSAEFALKAFSASALKTTETESQKDPLTTDAPKEEGEKTAKQKELDAFQASIDKRKEVRAGK